jgi:cupin 2 domain-containing protein
MEPTNVYENIPPVLPAELLETLWKTSNVRVERIVSRGHASAEGFWMDQAWDEWVIVLKGSASIRFAHESAPIVLCPGDSIHIPPHKLHRVDWTDSEDDTIWLAVHVKAS